MMISTMLVTLSGALALAASTVAIGPLAQEVSTSTAEARTIGTAVSDGHTVFSINQCTMYYTTACDVSISYGPPVPTPSVVVSSSATDFYPVPTSGEASSVQQSGLSSTEPTSAPYGVPSGSTSNGAASSSSASTNAVSSGPYPSVTVTSGEYSTGTATGTAETGSPTAGGVQVDIWPAPVLGAAAVAAFFLV